MYVTAVWDGSAKDMDDELRFKRRIIIVNAVRTAILFFFFEWHWQMEKSHPLITSDQILRALVSKPIVRIYIPTIIKTN